MPSERIEEIARLMRSGEAVGFFLSGSALFGCGLDAVGKLGGLTGVRMFANRFGGRLRGDAAGFRWRGSRISGSR